MRTKNVTDLVVEAHSAVKETRRSLTRIDALLKQAEELYAADHGRPSGGLDMDRLRISRAITELHWVGYTPLDADPVPIRGMP